MKHKVKALLFDIGGTLYKNKTFDSAFPKQVALLLAKRLGISELEASARIKQRQEELSTTEGDPSKVRAMATFGVSRTEVHKAFCEVNPNAFLRPEPEVAKVFEQLASRSLHMAILSNFRSTLVRAILKCLGIEFSLFEFALTEDDGLPIKPALEPFEEAVRRFRVPASQTGYVGDSLEKDIIPAKAAGMTTFWIHESPAAHAAADCVLPTVTDLLDHIA